MYKAQHLPSGQDIIILDPRWREQVAYLRTLDKSDRLVCPGCKQPVRVRAGKTRRWHFAHKHLQNCPFDRESPILLQTRAVLYEWLVEKFDAETVTLEKILTDSNLPRYVDCWVEKDSQLFAYWIFDRRMPPDERAHLKSGFDALEVHVHWVFVAEMLQIDQEIMQDRLYLTTTERAFIQQSEFDQAWQTHFEHLGGTLHYLDAEQETLVTFRNLNVIHAPQLYAGTRLEHPLAEILVSTPNGELIHPKEIDRLQKRQQEIALQAQKAEQRLLKAQAFFGKSPIDKGAAPMIETQSDKDQPFERVGTCRFCGTQTADWVSYFGQTQECICRNCKDQM